ncbi:yeats family-domain-containing protein [Absidia repens]|uniref:Yeats family-domain-containing protein n=1 Tax=Absidia repens TaxID=90262 RepID=A0A1X2INN3_9FUNG|nr:yeats family-domain-containing protein [Absidia repens]
MVDTSLDIKIACHSSVISGAAAIDGHPWRNWKLRLVAMEGGKEHKGKLTHVLDRVEYILHPTFENPRRVATCEPYMLQEKGWGEFDLRIVLYFVDNLVPPEVISFDLNFRTSSYSVIHKRPFPDAPAEFISILSKPTPQSTTLGSNKRSSPSLGGRLINSNNNNISSNNNSDSYHQAAVGSAPVLAAGPSFSPASSAYTSLHSGLPSSSVPAHEPASQQSPLDSSTLQKEDRPKRSRYGRSSGTTVAGGALSSSSSSSFSSNSMNNDSMAFNKTSGKRKDGLLTDDIYSEQDLEQVHPIHRAKLEPATRQAWGLPPNLDMIELAARLSRMNDDQVDEFQSIIQHAMHKDMTIEETEGNIRGRE